MGEVDVVGGAIEQPGIGRERGGLGEPGGVPVTRHFAARLVARTCAAIKPIKTRG